MHELIGGERPAELLAVERVLPGGVPAELGSAHRAPGDAEAGAVQAAKRAGQSGHVRQQIFRRHEHVLHHDLAGDRGAQAELALDPRRGEAFHPALQHEAADDTVIGLAQTTKTSAIGELVIHILAPVMRKPPSTDLPG